uniref:FGENESH: predicted gene_7.7 protein n=1 Tax=Rhodotorula toruloides TaxID=5286 RepID=A0A0K3CKM7_RHOTO
MRPSTLVLSLFSLGLVAAGSVGVVEGGGGGGDPFALLKRQRNGGGGRFAGLRQQLDGKLDPGNKGGQGQGTTNPAGTGSQQTNSTSGLPEGVVDTGDPQKNLFLDPSQIAKGLAQDGTTGAGSEAGASSFTSSPLTNGNQVKTGSCNAVPMGIIAAQTKMPSCKFVNPKNLDTIPANQDFEVQMAINNLVTGNFVNAQQNYFAAPQNVDQNGVIIGHSHVVIEPVDSLTTTTVSDPTQFAFFKGLNDAAQNGILSATVTGGLPAGTYKLSSINSAANHQPALVGVAQHGSLDDAVYFTVADNANAANSNGNANGGSNGNNAGQGQGQAQAQTTTSAANNGNNNVRQGQAQVQQAQATTTAAANNVGQGQAQVTASSSSSTTTTSAAANVGQGQAQVTTTTSAAGSNASSTSSSSATSTASLAARSALPNAHSNALSQRRHTNRARNSKYKLERRLEALPQA